MSDPNQTDQCMLEAIRRGDGQAWARLIDEYQGRLLRFALTRVSQQAAAADVVQDTFTSFVRAIDKLQLKVSIETYLFGILRNEIVNRFRTQAAGTICLIQDIYHTRAEPNADNPLEQVAAGDPGVSWCLRHSEQEQLQREVLEQALRQFVADCRETSKLRDLKIAELLFYCKVPNQDVANLLALDDGLVRVIKHRCLKRIRDYCLKLCPPGDGSVCCSQDLLTETWESHRLSCPKRSTLGAFLLETLAPEWFDYVDFHLTTVGCRFCRASFRDLKEEQDGRQQDDFGRRIMASPVGFLSQT
jgi:RNA polymerase sigma factor (sigma-70 family)